METNKEETADAKVTFKKKTRKNLRQTRITNNDNESKSELEEEPEPLKLEELRLRQKLRNRPNGINVALIGVKKLKTEENSTPKPGGMVNMQTIKLTKDKDMTEDAYDVGIGTQFSAETNKRDEDEEMMKYIEEELQKRKGVDKNLNDQNRDAEKYITPEEAALSALPDHLRNSTSKNSEEMLSNQMLNGIPEVDLGIEAKIKNIEATEEAKQKLLQDQKNKKDGPSQFVPTNMAVNFMQHNRFNIEESNDQQRKRKQMENREKANDNPGGIKKATDDYHYDKFRKQYRRY